MAALRSGAPRGWVSALLMMASAAPALARADPPSSSPTSLQDCDQAIQSHPRQNEAYACFVRLAHGWGRGRAPVQRHLEAWLRRHPGDLLAQLWLGILAHANSEGSEALRRLVPVAEVFHERHMDREEVLARAEVAIILCYDGRKSEADPHLSLLAAAAQRSGDPELEANALLAEAVCARKDHDHGRAIGLYTRARALLAAAPASFRTELLTGQILDGLGSALSDSGRHREAFAVFVEQSESLQRDLFQLAIVRHRLASQAVNLADEGELGWDEVDRRIRDSLEMEGKLSAPHWPPYATHILHAARLGPSAAGIAELDAALAFWRPRAAWGVLTALRLRAKFLSDLDPVHPAEALREADESLTMARSMGNHWNTGMALLVRSYVRWRSGDRPGGISDALATLDELDRLRDFQADRLVRAWTSSETTFAYPLIAGWLLDPARGAPRPEDVERAFQSMERHRARVLLEALVSARIGPTPPAGPQHDRQAQILAEITQLQRRLLDPSLPLEARHGAVEDLGRLEREEEVVRDELARIGRQGTALTLATPTLAEVQHTLEPDEALLSFQTWWPRHDQDATYQDGSSWVIAISRDTVRAARIPDANELREQLALLEGLLEIRNGAEASGASRLHQELLAEALGGLPRRVRHLVLIPDGPLHRFPFELLRERPDGEPLGTRYALSIVPSAALWLHWRAQRRTSAHAPDSGRAPLALVFANPSATWVEGATLPPLRSAEREARAIGAALAERALILLGQDASEHRIKRTNLQAFSILHFAAHSVIDERSPSRSALVLAPGASEEDGLLQVGEVTGLDLSGRLIVIAACRSASGALLGGEGPVSLARAFFQAGAPVVIGSSRPLRDDESTDLMSSFYSGLGRGLSVSTAMLHARRERRASGAPDAAWAGMTVLGDGALVPLPGGVGSPILALVLAGVAGGLVLAAGAVIHARLRSRAHPGRTG